MSRFYKVIRAIVMVAVVLAVVLPTLLYIALSLPFVQEKIKQIAETEVSNLIDAQVSIADLNIRPFNRVDLKGINVSIDGVPALKVSKIGASIDVYQLLLRGKLSFNHAEIIEPDVRLRRSTPDSPLNIQPIIDKLSPKDKNKPPTKFDLRVNTIVLRRASIRYDIASMPQNYDVFDPNHILVTDLQADICAHRISNDRISVDLRQLSFYEISGFTVNNIEGDVDISRNRIKWSGINIELPKSRIVIADADIAIDGFDSIRQRFDSDGFDVSIKDGSHIYLPDMEPFAGSLANLPISLNLLAEGHVSSSRIDVEDLLLGDASGNLVVAVTDAYIEEFRDPQKMKFKFDDITFFAGSKIFNHIKRQHIVKAPQLDAIDQVSLKLRASGSALQGKLSGEAEVNDSYLAVDGGFSRSSVTAPVNFSTSIEIDNLDLATLTRNNDFGTLNAVVEADGTIGRNIFKVSGNADINDFVYRDAVVESLSAVGQYDNGQFTGDLSVLSDDIDLTTSFSGSIRHGERRLDATVDMRKINLYALGLIKKYQNYSLSFSSDINLQGESLDRCDGAISIADILFHNPMDKSLAVKDILIETSSIDFPRSISVTSELISGEIIGDFKFNTIAQAAKELVYRALPTFNPNKERTQYAFVADASLRASGEELEKSASDIKLIDSTNRFSYNFTVTDTEKIADFLNLPVSVIYPMTIEGSFDSREGMALLSIDAPFIRQNNKLIEGTSLLASLNGRTGDDRLFVTTSLPTKDGELALMISGTATDNHIDFGMDWNIDRHRTYKGSFQMGADLSYDFADRKLVADIDVKPSEMIFNDSIWIINPAKIKVDGLKHVSVNDLNVYRSNQFVKINGVASESASDTITVDLLNINLDYVFETLNIDAVMLMGDASGTVTASSLFSPTPHLETEGIEVKNIGYNGCLLGDAIVKSHWDMDNKAVVLDGLITQRNGKQAKVEGEIFPTISSLDIRLYANETPVGFMQKYMGAFASDITGKASGFAHLYGTFHDIDMTGDIYAEDLKLKLNFTNTYFTATDSIKITPGRIDLKDITLKDLDGNTALLNGYVAHDFFRDPTFLFTISDVKNMLVYDETSKDNPDWYGKIYVNGGAKIQGKPGIVTINVDATTAPGSIFTFVLSEMEVADEYTFLTFRDKATIGKETVEIKEDANMRLVNHFRALADNNQAVGETQYEIELKIGITPQAEVDLVMDPVAGDKIRSNGSGNMRMVYKSKGNDLQMFGVYTLEQGTYNFTLQDIIIKDFIINQGSSIRFNGDPLAARLNVEAYYQLNANLSDLDESFLQDKDLNRTNVPVHAMLYVTGDIQQPQISFDLAFPTLTSDTYNKVKSIVSTEEMMNRQIIYLLALNRFYTPDYMSTTKGNELFSVASSTLTSQMSNILGRLSDKWTVSPNLRSDRGDFSDVEVDVALSSRLLNNRLLLNGNFGYRDKSLNTNQFIGDFEIEYLLNRAGTIRLKAYNYSNDENYYVRDAATTQGVGVMFKRDFDNIFSFLRPKRNTASLPAPSDTLTPVDTVSLPVTSPADTIR